MQLDFWEQSLPFEYPFTISNGRTKTHQHSLMVRLSLGNWSGFGEAPAIVYYNVTVADMMAQLEKQSLQRFCTLAKSVLLEHV